jgi:hypothetical protein
MDLEVQVVDRDEVAGSSAVARIRAAGSGVSSFRLAVVRARSASPSSRRGPSPPAVPSEHEPQADDDDRDEGDLDDRPLERRLDRDPMSTVALVTGRRSRSS